MLPHNFEKIRPQFFKGLFWDIDEGKLDYEKKAEWVVRRVFERGDLDDIFLLVYYYGSEKVMSVLKTTSGLKKSDMLLAALMFQLQPKDFVCYNLNQFHPGY